LEWFLRGKTVVLGEKTVPLSPQSTWASLKLYTILRV